MVDLALAFDAKENARLSRRSGGERAPGAHTPDAERIALEEPLAPWHGLAHEGCHGQDRTLREVHAGEGSIHLQRTRLARPGVDMLPVVETKRHVAVLLDLEDHDVAAQGVHNPRLHENGVARPRAEPGEQIRGITALDLSIAPRRALAVVPSFSPA